MEADGKVRLVQSPQLGIGYLIWLVWRCLFPITGMVAFRLDVEDVGSTPSSSLCSQYRLGLKEGHELETVNQIHLLCVPFQILQGRISIAGVG